MGRGKVQLKMIENRINRQVTFCKRKNGLLKKACELSVLCDAEVALLIFSNSGKLYEFSNPSMERTIQRYMASHDQKQMKLHTLSTDGDVEHWREEAIKLRQHMDSLTNAIRQLMGESFQSTNICDLEQLENKLEKALGSVRSRKDEKLFEEIENLKKRESLLLAHNQFLSRKIEQIEGQTIRKELQIFANGDVQNPEAATLESQQYSSQSTTNLLEMQLGDKLMNRDLDRERLHGTCKPS